MTDSYEDLLRFLNGVSAGVLNGEVASRLSKLLAVCWESFEGSSETLMAADKIRRTHEFKWNPPIVTFEIDRHLRTVHGSPRADRQEWEIDVEKRTARSVIIGYRQLAPNASRFKAEPVVHLFVDVISQRLTTPHGWNLTWISDDEIRVLVRSLLPDPNGFRKTIEGRVKRLRERLISAMAAKGWHVASNSGGYLRLRRGDGPTTT